MSRARRGRLREGIALATAMAAIAGLSRAAHACAVCALDDPTLSPAGGERPYRGRLRADASLLAGWIEEGAADDRWLRVDDARLAASVSWGASRDVLLTAVVPVLARTLEDGPSRTTSVVPGDVEARAYAVISRVQSDGASRQLALVGGIKTPTAPVERDARGAPLPAELQPGCSALVPYLGVAYSLGHGWISGDGSASLYLPFATRDAPHAGDSLRAAAALQLQPARWLATRFGLRAQVDATGELTPGVADLNSGGFLGYATSDLIVSPWTDLVFSVGASFPVVQALLGEHRASTIATGQVAYDF